MSDILLSLPQMKSGSSLARAAQTLAKAAATLAEAAQAMSAAANTFTSEILAQDPQADEVASPPTGTVPIVSYESDSESSPTEDVSGNRHEATEITEQESVQQSNQGDEECTNPEDSDYYVSEGDDFSASPPLDSVVDDVLNPGPPQSMPTEAEVVVESNPAYRILVDNEPDVLLFLCALIRSRKKVVCYMDCSIPALNLYKRLIHDVTETPVYIITKTTPAELEAVGQDFLKDCNSILLLPETVCPSLSLGDADSWVIHVGWPADEQKYEAQRKVHEAQNNVLIAYSEDKNRYPAGAAIMWQSKPWPGDVEAFRVSVNVLRPLFKDKLDAIPSDMKARVYPDWIDFHGPKGRRYVRSWTPSDLVYHANLYLLDVLGYHGPNDQASEPTMQVLLPEVSAGFVAHHQLESAVEEGVLRVKPRYAGLNHISSLSSDDFAPSGSTPLNERGAGEGYTRQESVGSTTNQVPRSSTPGPTLPKPDDTDTRPTVFKPTLGHTYFTLTEVFDAIPLMCFLALSSASAKVVIFLDYTGSLPHYQKLINKITGRNVIVPQISSENQAQANQDAVLLFAESSSSTILLLPYRISKLPSTLQNITIGYCIYWGAGSFAPMAQAKKHRTQLEQPITCVIMTTSQREQIAHLLVDIDEHPSSPDLLDLSARSWLSPMRKATRSALVANTPIVRDLYEAYLHSIAKPPRSAVSAEEVARRVNEFSAKVLLRGKSEDGSKNFPTVARRFATSAQIIANLDLQPAVTAGLLTVE